MDLPILRRRLLDLVGTVNGDVPGDLAPDDWDRLDTMAESRRLQPLLHVQHRDDPALPIRIAARWREAHRHSAIAALARRAELIELVAVLRAAGFAPIALKGAWLAHHAYPDPAQRPMFDLDLLVGTSEALGAYAALNAAGCVQLAREEMPLDQLLDYEKHLPPLRAPRGTVIELHHRLWEPDGRLAHASPVEDRAGLVARAVTDTDGIVYPGGEDMLAHLAVHAAYSHRFDCGPRVLADVDMLLGAVTIDWPRWWARAVAEGWRDGARLLLELVARYRPNAALDLAVDPGPAPSASLIEAAADLLLQAPDRCASAGFAAAVIKDGWPRLADRLTGKRHAGSAQARRSMASEGGALGWAASRAWRTMRDLAQRDVRRQARELAAVSRWLDR